MTSKIGIFGGTFDPPHKGHAGLAREILHKYGFSKIIFVPALMPPHKPRCPITPFRNRVEMLEIAIRGNAEFEISTFESENDGPSYTFYTLEHFSAANPDSEIVLIIGSDSVSQLHKWHRATEIVSGWELLIYPRPGYSSSMEELGKNWPPELAAKINSSIADLGKFDISSTEIRNRLKKTGNCDDFLDGRVYNYIVENGLYR